MSISPSKTNQIPGYTGFIPQPAEEVYIPGGVVERKSQIPGYAGYVPGIKPENMFGKPYGTLTYLSAQQAYHKGADVGPELRYNSTISETFVNQATQKRVQMDNVTRLGGHASFDEVMQATNTTRDAVQRENAKKRSQTVVNFATLERHIIDAFWGIDNVRNQQIRNEREAEELRRAYEEQMSRTRKEKLDSSVKGFWGDEGQQQNHLQRSINNLNSTGGVKLSYHEARARAYQS
eukprot:TRINITY_DN24495_c0_g1_i1.p1 TRINITY_DN24495_c0_g1~~TRINITY_DN24495_c0_g1_i1.p1  ORF type:complete len:235 (+),score=54.36 TRINITY_DN24495_c0_g1_i1:130-834(+)